VRIVASLKDDARLSGVASQHNERLAGLAAEIDVENGDIAPRLNPERTSSHLRPAFTAFVCTSLQKLQRNSPPPLAP
jgi:hypothetical protein